MSHWYKAQEEQRAKNGTNIVFAQNAQGKDVALVGNPSIGWWLVTPEGTVGANTVHGMEGVFEEFNMLFRDWH